MKIKSVLTFTCNFTVLLLCTASYGDISPSSSLPTVDPQARQILAAMVNTYHGFDIEEYADEETLMAAGNTEDVSPEVINSHFTVMLRRGFGVLLTATYASGEKVTVHTFPQNSDQTDAPFVVFTTNSRFPGHYLKDRMTDYQAALTSAFRRVGLGVVGAGALFSERDISSLLLNASFQGLRLGQPLTADGVSCDVVTIELDNAGGNNTLAICIGQKDHLLRRLTETHVKDSLTMTITESHSHIRTHGWPPFPPLFPASDFLYAPPRSYHLVKFFPFSVNPVHP